MGGVHLFVDYQNVHLSVIDAFAPPGTLAHTVLIHPGLFGDALMRHRLQNQRGGTLSEIHVYRGEPLSNRQPVPAARNKAQAAEWTRDRRVRMHTRPLRYPRDWPATKQREKGVDVMLACDLVRCALQKDADTIVLASRDTDLVPALEMATSLGVDVEVATWKGLSRLRLPGGNTLWCTYMTGEDYLASKDTRSYD